MDQGLVTGQSHVSPNATWLAGDEIRTQFDFTNCMEYPSLCTFERHSSSRKKGHFLWLIPTHLAPCIHTLSSGAGNYSGKCQCVSCARNELSGLVPPDIMEMNTHADSDLLQSCITRQNINNIGRCRSLTYFLLSTYEQFSLYLCVCVFMLYPTETFLQCRCQQHNNGEFIEWQIAVCYDNLTQLKVNSLLLSL